METVQKRSTTLQESVRERLLTRFRELGLTGYAAKAYLTLLTEPGISAGTICKETGIPDSKIYYALDELVRHHLVVMQRGNPSYYRPVDAKQTVENLKREAQEDFSRRVKGIEALTREIEPLLASHESEKSVELAYIIKGKRNVLSQMMRTIEAADSEVLLMNSGRDLLDGLLPALREARRRGLKVRIAIYGDLSAMRNFRFTELKLSKCDCNILITDSRRLVTVTRHYGEIAYAIVTDDPNIISVSRSFYKNPACCVIAK